MLRKTVDFLVGLLKILKKSITIPHSSEVESDFKVTKSMINTYVNKYGFSDFVYMITGLFLLFASIVLFCCFSIVLFSEV